MATTLTRAKQMTRLGLLGAGGLVVAIVLFRGMIGLINGLGQTSPNGTAKVAATVAFGEIPAPVLPNSAISAATAEVGLDLVAGSFPTVEPVADVYRVATPSLSLSAQDRARATASALGFSRTPTQQTPADFTWKVGERSLIYSLANHTFVLNTTISSLNMANRESFVFRSPVAAETAVYLQNVLTPSDIDFSQPVLRFVTPSQGGASFTPQSSESTTATNFAEVTFHRTRLSELRLYSSNGKQGPINAFVVPPLKGLTQNSNSRTRAISQDQLVRLVNNYFPIDKTEPATYPIINGQTAYELFKSSVVKSLTSVEPTTVSGRPTSLSRLQVLFAELVYLEPDPSNREFVQPVWLFEGRGTSDVGEVWWTAMVRAIDEQTTARLLKK